MEEFTQRVMELEDTSGASQNISKDPVVAWANNFLSPSKENTSRLTSTSSRVLPYFHSTGGESSVGHARHGQNLTFDTNDNDVLPFTSGPEPTQQDRGILSNQQIPSGNFFDEGPANYLDSLYAGLLESDLNGMECVDTQNTHALSFKSGPLEVSDYSISAPEVNDGILPFHSMDSETLNSNASISTDANYLGEQLGCNVMQDHLPYPIPASLQPNDSELACTLNSRCISNVMQFGLPPPVPRSTSATSAEVPGTSSIYDQSEAQFTPMTEDRVCREVEQNTAGQPAEGPIICSQERLLTEKDLSDTNYLSQQVGCEIMQGNLPYPSLPVNDSEIAFAMYPRCTSNDMQFRLPLPVPGSTSGTSSEVPGTSSIYNQGGAQQSIPMTEERVWIGVEQNTASQLAGGHTIVPKDRLLLEKELKNSDIDVYATGISLPKRCVELHFVHLSVSDKEGRAIRMHDAEENGRIWIMRLATISTSAGYIYRLKDTVKYTNHYRLKEGDFLRIFLLVDVPKDRLVLKFERRMSVYRRTALDNSRTDATAWTQIILKKLTQSDMKAGLVSSGIIFLGKKEVEAHFPPIQEKEGFLETFLDWEAKRTWQLRLKFKSKSRVYMLQNICGFLKFYSLGEGDKLDIFKSEARPANYALRARKLVPLI